MHLPALRYDVDKSGFIDLMELKLMMEKLGEPQTHLGLKGMIKEVDEDNDGEISFREVGRSNFNRDLAMPPLLSNMGKSSRFHLVA